MLKDAAQYFEHMLFVAFKFSWSKPLSFLKILMINFDDLIDTVRVADRSS